MNVFSGEMKERFLLVRERLQEIVTEEGCEADGAVGEYAKEVARFSLTLCEILESGCEAVAGWTLAQGQDMQKRLHEQITAEAYRSSYANPDVAVAAFGKMTGRLVSAVYSEVRATIPYAYAGLGTHVLYALELFLQVYGLLTEKASGNDIKRALFYYVHDYCEEFTGERIQMANTPDDGWYYSIVMQQDWDGLAYLYRFGAYISPVEWKMAAFLQTLPEEKIQAMADTFVDGYVRGFETMRMDFSKKSIVQLRTAIGFERVTKKAIERFHALGKKVLLYPGDARILYRSYGRPAGVYASSANWQYDYDHRNDLLLVLNRRLQEVYARSQRKAYEAMKESCAQYAGPAVQEVFGVPGFSPEAKDSVITPDARLSVLLQEKARTTSNIVHEYMNPEETSFTIIAYPVPEIGPNFEEIFEETIRVNTLDNDVYNDMQQCIIDVLDQGEAVHILGAGGNETDLTVALYPLSDPSAETIFENCTADVNIPVGEVFTSPRLTGTNGLLHVSQVFLDGTEYKNLRVWFRDGMISDYSCENYEDRELGRKLFRENVMKNRDTLPLGEFAIGTNTTAYRMARKYGIGAVMPILIAEKTGPHFAVGDTCYSHAEDHKVYNRNGKEIVARENEVVRLRHTEPEKAYFQCHTDITLPYDELGSITVLCKDGARLPIVAEGRFVVKGTELLNEALAE